MRKGIEHGCCKKHKGKNAEFFESFQRARDVSPRTLSEYVLAGSRLLHAPHTWREEERKRAARANVTSANVRSLHTAARTWNARAHASRRPARPPQAHNHAGARAARRPARPRAA
jgi:hypothetical protein